MVLSNSRCSSAPCRKASHAVFRVFVFQKLAFLHCKLDTAPHTLNISQRRAAGTPQRAGRLRLPQLRSTRAQPACRGAPPLAHRMRGILARAPRSARMARRCPRRRSTPFGTSRGGALQARARAGEGGGRGRGGRGGGGCGSGGGGCGAARRRRRFDSADVGAIANGRCCDALGRRYATQRHKRRPRPVCSGRWQRESLWQRESRSHGSGREGRRPGWQGWWRWQRRCWRQRGGVSLETRGGGGGGGGGGSGGAVAVECRLGVCGEAGDVRRRRRRRARHPHPHRRQPFQPSHSQRA